MYVGAGREGLGDFVSKYRVAEGELVGNRREDELDIAAIASACTEETCAEVVLTIASCCDSVGDGGLSRPREPVDPENRLRLRDLKDFLGWKSSVFFAVRLDPGLYGREDFLPCGRHALDPTAAGVVEPRFANGSQH